MFVPPEIWPARGRDIADPLGMYRADGRRLILTHCCRTAFDLALGLLQLEPGDKVLLPAFLDGTSISVARRRGLEVAFYRVGPDLRADLEDLSKGIGPRTRVVYLIHYLGFPQDAAAVRRRCEEKGAKLVEDCAHALHSADGRILIGTTGHLAIFSLRKALGLPDGGVLMLNQESLPDPPPLARAPAGLVMSRAARLLCFRYAPGAVLRRALKKAAQPGAAHTPEWAFLDGQRGRAMSKLSQRLLRRFDPDVRKASMRSVFEHLAREWPDAPGIEPVHRALPPGVCPRAFAVQCADRERLLHALHIRGVVAYRLWAKPLPDDPTRNVPEAKALRESILILPLRVGLDNNALSAMLDAAREVANERQRQT